MSDNFYNTTFGPSTPGHLNLVSGQTHGAKPGDGTTLSTLLSDGDVTACVQNGVCTVIGDPQPAFDDCSARETVKMSDTN
jgi:phospholipase C